jgi:hypothetical protein
MIVFGNFPLDGKNTEVYVEIPLYVVASNAPLYNKPDLERVFHFGNNKRDFYDLNPLIFICCTPLHVEKIGVLLQKRGIFLIFLTFSKK